MAKKLTFAVYDARRMFLGDITNELAEIREGICKRITERYLAELPTELVKMFKECPKSFTELEAVYINTIFPFSAGDTYESIKLGVPKGSDEEREKILKVIFRDEQFMSEIEKDWKEYKTLLHRCNNLTSNIGKFMSSCNTDENLQKTYPELYDAYIEFHKEEPKGSSPCDDIERVRAELSGITTEK